MEVPVTQQPLQAAIHFAEEALFSLYKQESAIKSCTRINKNSAGDGRRRRRDESPQRLADRAYVTQVTLFGTALSTDISHELLCIAAHNAAVRAIMIDSFR